MRMHANRTNDNIFMTVKKLNEIKGTPAFTKGIVKGIAFVFKGKKDEKFKIPEISDYILVVGKTKPLLAPAISKAKAIVTEEGGLTSHVANISRELEIPCIIAAKDITKAIKSGEMIEVDSEKGTIKKV